RGSDHFTHLTANVLQESAGARPERRHLVRGGALLSGTGPIFASHHCRIQHNATSFLYADNLLAVPRQPLNGSGLQTASLSWQGRSDSNREVRFWRPTV